MYQRHEHAEELAATEMNLVVLKRHSCFRASRYRLLLVACIAVGIVWLFAQHVGHVGKSSSSSGEPRAAGKDGVSTASSRPVWISSSPGLTRAAPQVLLEQCCSELLVDSRLRPRDSCWRNAEKLRTPANNPGTRSLFPDDLDPKPLECLLKNTPVRSVQLFSNQDNWFRHLFATRQSLEGSEPPLSNGMTSLPDTGSTHKWFVMLEGGQGAIFKPKWYAYNVTFSNWFLGYELHTSEILAYHLDRALGFGRYPTTVERLFHISSDIMSHSSPQLKQYISPKDGEWCLRDKCYFCTTEVEVCTRKGLLAGSLSYYITGQIERVPHPWNIKEYYKYVPHGFNNQSQCQFARLGHSAFMNQDLFLDLVDMNILDYLCYHFDTKFYVLRRGKSSDITLHLDRGRAVRASTWKRLNVLRQRKLSSVVRASLGEYRELVAGLPASLFEALDRRLEILIGTISQCINENENFAVLL